MDTKLHSNKCSYSHYILIVVIWQSVLHTQAKYIEGEINTKENWIFLTRFCFYSRSGHFSYHIRYPINYAVQNILLYYDEPWQWPAVYKTKKTCEEKEAVLEPQNQQIVSLSVADECEIVNVSKGDEPMYDCAGDRRFSTARERWWFVAISNCQSTKGLKLTYWIKMTNGIAGDVRFEQFSADEFGILEMSVAFLILDAAVLGMSIVTAVHLRQRYLLHVTYKIYMFAITIHCLSLVFQSAAYCRYAMDGIGLPDIKFWGQLLQSISQTIFLFLLLLLAKGYTVTRARIGRTGTIALLGFMFVYSVTTVALFAYKEMIFDPGEVLYLYESPPGIWLVILKGLSWGMFVIFIMFTLKRYPEKRLFYLPFMAFYTFWFVAGPMVIILANYVIDKWVREKILCGVDLTISYLAFLVFWCLTIPSFNNVNFPYHVRTSQIGVSTVQQDGVVMATNLESFSHHSYAPSAPPLTTFVQDIRQNRAFSNNLPPSVVILHPSFLQSDANLTNGISIPAHPNYTGNNILCETQTNRVVSSIPDTTTD